jgi:hypothetical protein
MKSKCTFAYGILLILAFVSAISIETAMAQPTGRLIVARQATFGWNVGVALEIDGRPVGTSVQGRYYNTQLPAGQHVLTVRKIPRTGISGPTSTTVNIQPGWTYVYTAWWDSDFVFLRPTGAWVTPGEQWQLGWAARPSHGWARAIE